MCKKEEIRRSHAKCFFRWLFSFGISYVVHRALILDKTIKDLLIHYYYLLVRAERNLSFIKAKSQRSAGTLASFEHGELYWSAERERG